MTVLLHLFLDFSADNGNGFSKFIFIADKLIVKISNSGRTIPTLTTSPTIPRFLGQKWERRCADSGLFRIQTHAPPPAGSFSKINFCCGESPTLLPFKLLILTPPAKIVDNCLPLRFRRQFFAYAFLTSSEIRKKKLPVGTRCQSSFIFGNGRPAMPEQTPW